MLPNFGYGRQIMHTDVKKQGLPQMSANRPSIWFTGVLRGSTQTQPREFVDILGHGVFLEKCRIQWVSCDAQVYLDGAGSRKTWGERLGGRPADLYMISYI